MTPDAMLFRHRADFCARIRSQVTLLTFGIIRRDVSRESPVRIMACRAGDTPVSGIIATAVGETVELEADINNPAWPVGRNIGPARMTFAAQVRELLGFHRGKLWHDCSGGVSASHCGGVPGGAGVALDTLHAG